MRKLLPYFLTPILLVTPLASFGAIARDNSATSSRVTASSLTYAFTVTGSNPILFVSATIDQSTDFEQVTSITYNGVSMTNIGGVVVLTGGTGNVYLDYLNGPSTGSNNIVVTKNGSGQGLTSFASSYTGVSQSGIDASSVNGPTGTQTNFTQSVTIVANNSWAIEADINSAGQATAGTNNNELQANAFGQFLGDSNAAEPPGSFSLTTNRATAVWGGIMASFAPFVASAAVPLDDDILYQ